MKTLVDAFLGFLVAWSGSLTTAMSMPDAPNDLADLPQRIWLIALLFGVAAAAKTAQSRLTDPKAPQ